MNKVFSYILTSIVSAAAASSLTYFVLNKKYNDMMNEEYQEWKHREPKEPEGVVIPEYAPDEKENPKEERREIKTALEEMNEIIEEEKYYIPEGLAENESPQEDEPEEINIISCEEYDNDHPEYDKKIYLYYEEDDVVVDEKTNKIVFNPEDSIGYDALTSFEDGVNTTYVRNPKISTDFEIVKLNKRYYNDNSMKENRKSRSIWDE